MSAATPQLTDVKGVGDATAANLTAIGIDSVEALAGASAEEIARVPGFGPARAAAVRAAAAASLEESATTEEPAVEAEPAAEKKGKGKKGKGKKGKKGKGKKGKGKKGKGKKKK